jgi:anti-sigma B factor antagonist
MAANPATPLPELTFETERSIDGAIIRCHGRITSNTTSLLQNAAKAALPGTQRLVLDFTDVTYLDSSGLGAMVGIYVSAKRAGSALKLINLSPRVKELFSMTRLAGIFEGHDDMLGMTPD